jgi:O-antigen biosynthesis protein
MPPVDEAQVCLDQAQTYWQAKQWQETIEACTKVIRLAPSLPNTLNQQLPQAYKLMGDALQKIGKFQEAIDYYRQAIALDSNYAEVYANLGTLYAQQQQYNQATACYHQALKIKPEFIQVYRYLAKVCQLQQQEEKAQAYLAQAKQLTAQSKSNMIVTSTLDDYLRQGKILEQQGQLEAARQQYLQAAELAPQRLETYQEIIKISEQLELWEEAAKYCRIVLQLTNSGNLHTPPSQALTQIGDQKAAIESCLQTISLDNEATSAAEYLELAQNLASWGKQQSALTCYRRAIERQPDLIAAYLGLGELLAQLGGKEPGITCYLQGLKYDQQHPELYYRLGNLYSTNQQWSQAALCYQKATQYAPDHGAAYHQLGEALSHQEHWSDAILAYRQAIKFQPDFSWSYNNLGYALIQLGQWTEAIPIYHQAIKLKPDFPWSYYNLAEAHSQLHQWSEAIAFYQQAAEIQVDLPKIQQKLGDAYYRQSQQYREQALKHFQLAIKQDPSDPQAYHQALAIDKNNLDLYLKLGELLVQQGQLDEGIVTYQMALQVQPKNSEALARVQALLKRDPNCDVSQVIEQNSLPEPKFQADQNDFQAIAAELQQTLPHSDLPEISIIIPVYNQLGYTLKCLKAIATNLAKTTLVEIIVIDDCSTDQTSEILETITPITLIKQPSNQGFIHSCNQGASVAKGKYLYFLNNDTEIQPNCLESLIEVLAQDEQVGAVGSKLIYPQGSLQEAGGLIWQDASGWNYGRNDNPYAPEYNYLREVDYCSGASLMVRKAIFESLEGFEQNFAPAYYEDTDLCFAIRHQLGLKVMYQPQSQVIHYEGISSGTSITTGVKQYQTINASKFKHKWQTVLENDNYLPNLGITNVPLAAKKYSGKQTVLVIDSYLPCYDRESGSRRLFEIIKILKTLNCHVIFLPDNGFKAEPYTSILQNLQIEVLYTQPGYGTPLDKQLNERLSLINIAWICRPELNEKYAAIIRQNQTIKIIYDTIDLHYLRLKRAWKLSSNQNPEAATAWIDMKAKELKMAHQADLTVTVTSVEQQILQSQAVGNVVVIPNIHTPYQDNIPSFDEREGILFIGSYNHLPNIDAVLWLCQEIMPLVWQTNPHLKVTLLGSNPTSEVQALANNLITVTGYINDLTPYFLSHKLSVSPLRYGAGMKGKIGQSLEYKLPVVSTNIGTEGMNLIPEQHILEANTTEAFARQILRLDQEADLWNYLAANSQDIIKKFTPEVVKPNIEQIIERLI